MAAGLEQELQTLQALAANVAKELRELRKRLAESEEREAELRRQLEIKEAELANAQIDIHYLRVSHRLASSPDTIVEARRMISGLIRNIDKAMADLKE